MGRPMSISFYIRPRRIGYLGQGAIGKCLG
jgi:hypothetical protein